MAEKRQTKREKQAAGLAEPFPSHLILQNPKGMDYVPVAEVVQRMNETVGAGAWRVEVISRDVYGRVDTAQGSFPAQIVVQVRVHVKLGTEWTSQDGFGGQAVETTRATVKVVDRQLPKGLATDLGDTFKGAASDATKKALQHYGVALELARKDEALHHERLARSEALGEPLDAPSNLMTPEELEAALEGLDVPEPAAIAQVVASKVRGANAKAFMKYRREARLPSDLNQMDEAQAAGLWAFLVPLLEPDDSENWAGY